MGMLAHVPRSDLDPSASDLDPVHAMLKLHHRSLHVVSVLVSVLEKAFWEDALPAHHT